ncbi:Transcription initiation factor TFIID subunit 13 [Myotisia sp. PD_48]|nr:Transcription initiation factor TFIID subunit 13 [Myotisia sp. PD_48]
MSEPRVRLARHQGHLSFGNEIRQLLYAYGDTVPHSSFAQEPNTETVRVLDEIVTDFIIETCHEAARVASYSSRQKVKVDDFRFILRRDPIKLGRVQELFRLERELKDARKAFDQNDDRVGGGLKNVTKTDLEELAEAAGLEEDNVSKGGSMGTKTKRKAKTTGKRSTTGAASESQVGKKRKLNSLDINTAS